MASEQYLVLARKYRPVSFDDVVGQQHITRTLQNGIASGRIGHAFLFIGSRGIGKTTSARILAKALNCSAAKKPTPNPCNACSNCISIGQGTNIDVIEIDGASNNSVEDVRQIRENIQLVPAGSRYKIYIIDEVHQLSPGAFNALLKTLEEPPPHAIFILATTESHKVPATIISRCQRYDFRRVGLESICTLLARILEAEGVTYTQDALYAIARAADGGIRDSESILEQVISYCGDHVTFEAVNDVLGLVDWQTMHGLCDAVCNKDIGTQLQIVEDVVVQGKDLPQFMEEILRYFRNLLVCKTSDAETMLALPPEELAALKQRAARFGLTELIRIVEQFSELFKRDFDVQLAPRIALEALLIRLSRVGVDVSLDTVLDKLVQLGAGGVGREAAEARPEGAPPPGPPAPLPNKRPAPRRAEAQTPRRIEMTPEGLAEGWHAVLDVARHTDLTTSVWLAHAAPLALEGDCLVLEFAADQASSRNALERGETRKTCEELLARYTSNVCRFRTVLNESRKEVFREQPEHVRLAAGNVTPEAVRAALENPAVAHVVELFKGRIVEIKQRTPNEDR